MSNMFDHFSNKKQDHTSSGGLKVILGDFGDFGGPKCGYGHSGPLWYLDHGSLMQNELPI